MLEVPPVFIATQLTFHEQPIHLLALNSNDRFGGEAYPAQLQFLTDVLSVGHELFTLFIHLINPSLSVLLACPQGVGLSQFLNQTMSPNVFFEVLGVL